MTNTKTITNDPPSLFTRKVSAVGGIIDTPNFGNGVKKTDSEAGAIVNTGLKKALSPLYNRNKVIQGYFDLYVQSGIIEFFATEIRKDFNIPELNADTDYHVIPQSDTNGESYDLEISDCYEELAQDEQEKLNVRIYKTIKQLYLPRSTFEMLLHYCLYGKRLNSYPFYDMDMITCIAEGTIPDNEFLGYSKNEIEFLKASAIFLLGNKREAVKHDSILLEQEKQIMLALIDKQMRLVPKRCEDILKNLERKNRPLRDLEMDIKIIIAIRDDYKRKRIRIDKTVPIALDVSGERYKYYEEEWTKTSYNIVAEMFPDIPVHKTPKKAAWFRKRVEQLKRKFPFLDEFIEKSNLK